MKSVWEKVNNQRQLIVASFGVLFVALWTFLRLFSQRTIYDNISQQVVVHQWLNGSMSPANMGQTSYILKMLLLYIPLDLMPGSPRLKLILATLAINILTFVLIGYVLRKILALFNIESNGNLALSWLWLTAIAGSVFWIGFVNSRNIEVTGGLYMIYLSLAFLREPTKKSSLWLMALSSILFFADPLQFYMTALPIILFVAILYLTKHLSYRPAFSLILILITGFVISKGLFALVHQILQLSFGETGNLSIPTLTMPWVEASFKGIVSSVITLFAGGGDAGKLRELINILFFSAGVTAFALTAAKGQTSKRFILMIACLVVGDLQVYVVSGQAAQAGTSRYLIMLAPTCVLAFATIRLPKHSSRFLIPGIVAILFVINLGPLLRVFYGYRATSFRQDAHIESTFRYIENSPQRQVYASIDTVMPLLYYHSFTAQKALPLGCLNGSLVKTHYSMDAAFNQANKQPDKTAAVILDHTSITNTPNVCTEESLKRQFGTPLGREKTDDGSIVLLYRESSLVIR